MTEPIHDAAYWGQRLKLAQSREKLHHAIYLTSTDEWQAIEKRHIKELAEIIKPGDSVLDAGCAWGRLLNMLPDTWYGNYLGVDLSPDFIKLAEIQFPNREFHVGKLEDISQITDGRVFDVGVLISIKGMVIANQGKEAWKLVESELSKVCRRLVVLEYA